MFDLNGRTALVTGAGQNVGEGIARALAERGAAVIVNDYHLDRATRVAQEIDGHGGSATAVAFDVTELSGVRDAFAKITDQVGPVDILVNNAGTGGPDEPMRMGQFVDLEPADWNTLLEVNLIGVLNCCKVAVPPMVERGWGRVITMSSGAGQIGMNIGVSLYAAAKAGAIGFTRHLAIETARQGVTANTIALGLVLPDPSALPELARSIPVGRLGTPSDVGALAVYLASPEAAWMTGQTVNLNGGAVTS